MRQLVIISTWIMLLGRLFGDDVPLSGGIENKDTTDPMSNKTVGETTNTTKKDGEITNSTKTDVEKNDSLNNTKSPDGQDVDVLHTDPTTQHNLTPEGNSTNTGKGNGTVDHTEEPDTDDNPTHHVKPLVVHIGDINGTTFGGNDTVDHTEVPDTGDNATYHVKPLVVHIGDINGTTVGGNETVHHTEVPDTGDNATYHVKPLVVHIGDINGTTGGGNGTITNGTIVDTTPTPVNGTDSNGTIANTTTTPGNIHGNGTDSNGTIPGVDPVKGDVVVHGWKNVIELENDTNPDIAGWARVDRICDDNLIKLDDNKVISKKFGPYNQTISYTNVLGDDVDFPGVSLSGGGLGQKEVTFSFQASDKKRIYLATICTTKPVR